MATGAIFFRPRIKFIHFLLTFSTEFIALAVNLIENPNFVAQNWNQNGDTVDMRKEPWELIETGGDGWKLEKTPQGSYSSSG